MFYSEEFRVRWHETDLNRVNRPSAFLTILQETANHQLHDAGMDLDALRDEKRVGFILSRIAAKIASPLRAYETITAQTWICPSRGVNFERCFRVLRGGEPIAVCWSSWGLLSLDERRLLPVDALDYPITPEEKLLPAGVPCRFHLPHTSEMEFVGTRTIRYSDLDYNGHMNNTRYPDMLADFLPDPTSVWVNGFSLSFLQEAKFGGTLSVYRAPKPPAAGEDEGFFFRTVDEEGNTCLEALLTVLPKEILPSI